MKFKIWNTISLAFIIVFLTNTQVAAQEAEIIKTNIDGSGQKIVLTVTAGKAHNHPMMAAWTEDMDGNFLQTLYVNQSVAAGYYAYAEKSGGKWQPGAAVRPAALPVWAHSRSVKSDDGHFMPTMQNPVPDALTSATPAADFGIYSKMNEPYSGKLKVFFEINQSWDWNEFWTNSKFPDDVEYKTSSQPSVVYSAVIDLDNPKKTYTLQAVGHGHYSGQDGEIYTDLSTITTALEIVKSVKVEIE
jgi:hypothetical protein